MSGPRLPLFRFLLLSVLVGLVTGCAGAFSRSPEPAAPSPAAPTSNKALGRAFLAEALKTFRFVTDPDVTGPVQATGRRLVEAIGEDPGRFHFFVVDEPQPNAFAVPGGYIFVFTGLLTKLGDVEELAGVLAHEIGHVTHNHFFQDSKKIQALTLASLAALLLSRGDPAAFAFTQGAAYHLQLGYSREHEAQADASAVRYLRQARYHPGGLVRFFKTLEFYERFNPPQVPAYFTTHPGVSERIRVVQALAGNSAPSRSPDLADLPDLAHLAPLDWGRVRASLEVPSTDAAPATLDQRHLQAVGWLKHDRVTAAIDALRALLEEDPLRASARADLALALLKQQELDEAQRQALRSLADDPTQATASIVLGIVAQGQGEHATAITRFEAAVTGEPRDPMTHLRLAQSLSARDDRIAEAYHLGRYFRLNLTPGAAMVHFERVAAEPDVDPELKRRVEQELLELRREGI